MPLSFLHPFSLVQLGKLLNISGFNITLELKHRTVGVLVLVPFEKAKRILESFLESHGKIPIVFS